MLSCINIKNIITNQYDNHALGLMTRYKNIDTFRKLVKPVIEDNALALRKKFV